MTHRFASEYRAMARDSLRGKWRIAILVSFVASLLGGNIASENIFSGSSDSSDAISSRIGFEGVLIVLAVCAAVVVIALFISGVCRLGYATFNLDLVDGKEVSLKTLFSHVDNLMPAFRLEGLRCIYLILWTLLFIIPGIVKGYSYALSPYLMAENPNWSATDCLDESRRLMNGRKWNLFCLDLSFIGWVLLCALPLIFVGAIPEFSRTYIPRLSLLLWSLPALALSFAGEVVLAAYQEAAWAHFCRDIIPAKREPSLPEAEPFSDNSF